MDLIAHLATGFGVALTPQNLAFAAGGALLGSVVAALPGLSLVVLLALLLPIVRALPAVPALILMTGLVMGGAGAQRRGAFGVNPTVFLAAAVSVAVVALLLQPLADFANRLGPADWVAAVLLVLAGTVVLASDSLLRGMAMVLFGLLLAQIGNDPASGTTRYGFGLAPLGQGIPLLAVAVGLYAIAPAMRTATALLRGSSRHDASALPAATEVSPGAAPSRWHAWRRRLPAVLLLVDGQNLRQVGVSAVWIPLFGFGLPATAPSALLFGAMVLKGIQPGPELVTTRPLLLWGLLVSLWVGAAVSALLTLPLLRLQTLRLWLAQRSERLSVALVVVLAATGIYTLGGGGYVLWAAAAFGVLGTVLQRLGCPSAPLFLGFLLAPLLEVNLRRALLLSDGDWSIFVTRPVSSGLLVAAALVIAVGLLPPARKRRKRTLRSG